MEKSETYKVEWVETVEGTNTTYAKTRTYRTARGANAKASSLIGKGVENLRIYRGEKPVDVQTIGKDNAPKPNFMCDKLPVPEIRPDFSNAVDVIRIERQNYWKEYRGRIINHIRATLSCGQPFSFLAIQDIFKTSQVYRDDEDADNKANAIECCSTINKVYEESISKWLRGLGFEVLLHIHPEHPALKVSIKSM